MKYPQLVSPRAVNAISGWLVSRLEQLGVESPQIYTRLLLSLLQSSVQVNDPIEYSNLEAFFANHKGGHKRFHLPSDTEALKKLNAVQCLREIVSTEQETATIEQLVDELCEKLKDIETQTQNLNDEVRFLIETHLNTDSLLQTQANTRLQQQKHSSSSNSNNQHHSRQHHHHHHQQQPISSYIYNNSSHSSATVNGDSKRHNHEVATTGTDALNDSDNDPKKRYFRAFPALSKEMEDYFRVYRRTAKSLTWPIVGRSIGVDSSNNLNNSSVSISSSSASSIKSSSNFVGVKSVSGDKSTDKKLKGEESGQHFEKKVGAKTSINIAGSDCGANSNIGGNDVQEQQGAVAAAASVKKKSKRRRNQALCKGKTTQNIRKLPVGTTSNSVGGNKYHHYTHQRNSSPAWDTDFKGCWEMGPDLIKEFLSRQNKQGNKRTRSNSDNMDQEEDNERKITNEMPAEDNKPIMKRYIDLSFCCNDDDGDDTRRHHYTKEGVDYVDEDYDDDNTLATLSELAMDSINPKRLYQREGHLQKSMTCNALIDKFDNGGNTFDDNSDSVETLDFQQFKAKFNSSIEALWKDAEPTSSISTSCTADNSLKVNSLGSSGISSAFYATTSLNALAPFKKDLWNFWSNYNQQHYDQLTNKLSTTASTSSMITTRLDDSSASSGAGADIANSSDYFSMPSNLDDFDKSVGGIRRINEVGASLDAHTPSINVFLQNSIWSTSGDCVDVIGTSSAADTDKSFLFKVWHSNKKLSQLDVGNSSSGEKMTTLAVDIDCSANDYIKSKESVAGANLQLPPYQNLKWSEGINAGPPCNSLRTHTNATINDIESLSSTSSLKVDNNFPIFSSAANITGATWEAPAYGENSQPDLKSWCASNPMSLTEMYGKDVCDSIVNHSSLENPELNQSDMTIGPAITLPNHCANTSGFIAYARIKQFGIVKAQPKPLQSSNVSRLPKDFFKSTEEENLLTSERTHFHPIENFVDGHTFNISNALDTIEFERTASGLMYYESEEYLEYTRNDIYMADEEVATNATNLLKYGRKAKEDKKEMFIIKFRLRRSGEIGCQTDEQDFHLAAAKMAKVAASFTFSSSCFPPPPTIELSNMYHNTFALSRQANNEAIMAAVTKAVAAAAKAAAENHLNAGQFSWVHPTNPNAVTATTTTIENNPIWIPDTSVGDEVDFCKIDALNGSSICSKAIDIGGQQQLSQNWSMHEVEKQCHQRRCTSQKQQEIKRKFPTSVDIERSEENSLDNTSLHTLWGMCAVCNSCEYGKSLPANRLLRDELQVEADEIMSDLRYMQDLYIGESTILSESNEVNDEDTDTGTDDKLNFNNHKGIDDGNSTKYAWNLDNKKCDLVQASMLQKVNQLIEDLLKPENTGKAPRGKMEYDEVIKERELSNTWNMHDDKANANNLWKFEEQDDNNIWQHKPLNHFEGKIMEKGEIFMKPMELLKQVGSSLNKDPLYMETLNWEHDNLAKIWEQSTIPNSYQMDETFTKHNPNDISNEIITENLIKEDESILENNQKLIEVEKNLKNLQNINAMTPPSMVTCNTYKRVQQFLNNSAAKLKIAANRKRRHSASQNFYHQQHLQYNNNNNTNSNNNNDTVADLNAYKQNLNDSIKPAKEQQQLQQLKQNQEVQSYSSNATMNNALEEKPTKQTIITCKYWTTTTNGTQSSLDSAAAAMMLLAAATNVNQANDMLTAVNDDTYDPEDVMLEENIFGNTFSCLIDKNASILKHVTMMTRPLTR